MEFLEILSAAGITVGSDLLAFDDLGVEFWSYTRGLSEAEGFEESHVI